MPDEFLTVVSYKDAIVPAWIHQADDTQEGYTGDAIREAFREGVDAAYNVECKGSCSSSADYQPPLVVNVGDLEPDRSKVFYDIDGDHWRYSEGWRWNGATVCSAWSVVQEAYSGAFPWTEVR